MAAYIPNYNNYSVEELRSKLADFKRNYKNIINDKINDLADIDFSEYTKEQLVNQVKGIYREARLVYEDRELDEKYIEIFQAIPVPEDKENLLTYCWVLQELKFEVDTYNKFDPLRSSQQDSNIFYKFYKVETNTKKHLKSLGLNNDLDFEFFTKKQENKKILKVFLIIFASLLILIAILLLCGVK